MPQTEIIHRADGSRLRWRAARGESFANIREVDEGNVRITFLLDPNKPWCEVDPKTGLRLAWLLFKTCVRAWVRF